MTTMARPRSSTWKAKLLWVASMSIVAVLVTAAVPITLTEHGSARPVAVSGREPSTIFCSAMTPYLEQHGSLKAALVCYAVMGGSSTTSKAQITTY